MIARPARQPCDFHSFGPEPRIPPRRRPGWFRRSIYSHYWRRRGGGNVQRPGVAADEQPAALDERPQLGQIKLPDVHHPLGSRSQQSSCIGGNPHRRWPIGWPGAQDDPPARRPTGEFRNQPCKRRFRPASERVPGADVDHDEFMRRCDAAVVKPFGNPCVGVRVARHLHRVARRIGFFLRPAVDRFEQVPLIPYRMPGSQRARSRHGFRVHPRPAGDLVADSLRRPGQPRQPRASRPAVQIDDEIIPFASKTPGQLEIRADPR